MTNPSDHQPPKREVYTDADGNIRTKGTHHRDGYTDGREVEEERLFVNQRVRSNGAGPGLLIGIGLAALLGAGVVVWYLLSQSSNEPTQQIIVPDNEAPTAPQVPASPPDVDITVPSVEVPQAPQVPSPPDVNITVPSVEVPQAPQAPSSSPQNNSNTTTPSSQPGTTNTTPTSPSNSSTTNPTDNSTDSTNSGQDQ